MSKKISALTALTTPADGDYLPIVDSSDTTDAASGTTKKIAVSAFFPTSSTDNAIARFDDITGKLLQNSAITVSDLSGNIVGFTCPQLTGSVGTRLQMYAGASADDVGGILFLSGGIPGTNKAGGAGYLKGADGNGTGAGGLGQLYGGTGGATGAGGAALVQGGAGGATSGEGGSVEIKGGIGTNGNANGGNLSLFPGAKNGSGADGTIRLYQSTASTYGSILDLSLIASSSKTFTFPNATGSFAVVSSGTADPTAGAAPAAIGLIYCKTDTGKVYISTGVSAGSDWKILN